MITNYRTVASRFFGFIVLVYVLISQPPDLLPAVMTRAGAVIGVILLTFGSIGRIWCLMFISGRKNSVLITDGPYSVVRNPLYLFNFIGGVGFGLAVENPLLAGAIAVFLSVSYTLAVASEEAKLRELFGDTYSVYCAETPRWLPRWTNYHESEVVTVCTVKIRNGLFEAMWLLWAFLLWEAVVEFRHIGLLKTLI